MNSLLRLSRPQVYSPQWSLWTNQPDALGHEPQSEVDERRRDFFVLGCLALTNTLLDLFLGGVDFWKL